MTDDNINATEDVAQPEQETQTDTSSETPTTPPAQEAPPQEEGGTTDTPSTEDTKGDKDVPPDNVKEPEQKTEEKKQEEPVKLSFKDGDDDSIDSAWVAIANEMEDYKEQFDQYAETLDSSKLPLDEMNVKFGKDKVDELLQSTRKSIERGQKIIDQVVQLAGSEDEWVKIRDYAKENMSSEEYTQLAQVIPQGGKLSQLAVQEMKTLYSKNNSTGESGLVKADGVAATTGPHMSREEYLAARTAADKLTDPADRQTAIEKAQQARIATMKAQGLL